MVYNIKVYPILFKYICNSLIPLIFLDIPGLKENLDKCRAVERPWTGWSDNYSILLADILSFGRDISMSQRFST